MNNGIINLMKYVILDATTQEQSYTNKINAPRMFFAMEKINQDLNFNYRDVLIQITENLTAWNTILRIKYNIFELTEAQLYDDIHHLNKKSFKYANIADDTLTIEYLQLKNGCWYNVSTDHLIETLADLNEPLKIDNSRDIIIKTLIEHPIINMPTWIDYQESIKTECQENDYSYQNVITDVKNELSNYIIDYGTSQKHSTEYKKELGNAKSPMKIYTNVKKGEFKTLNMDIMMSLMIKMKADECG